MNQQDYDRLAGSRARRGTLVALFAGPLAILWAAGCASTKVTDHEVLVNEQLPRPGHIWVYDFAATAAAVPADSTLARRFAIEATPQTDEQLALGRRLGAAIAADLVQRIQKMGLLAQLATGGETIDVNDLLIRGYLVSVKKGNAAERIVIGFGVGASELRSIVEGFQMTPQGLRELTFDAVRAAGGKNPGTSVSIAGLLATGYPFGLIVSSGMRVYDEASGHGTVVGRARATAKEIALELKKVFREEGWIVR
jgi:hypothetical protein